MNILSMALSTIAILVFLVITIAGLAHIAESPALGATCFVGGLIALTILHDRLGAILETLLEIRRIAETHPPAAPRPAPPSAPTPGPTA